MRHVLNWLAFSAIDPVRVPGLPTPRGSTSCPVRRRVDSVLWWIPLAVGFGWFCPATSRARSRFDLVDPPAADRSGFPRLRSVGGHFLVVQPSFATKLRRIPDPSRPVCFLPGYARDPASGRIQVNRASLPCTGFCPATVDHKYPNPYRGGDCKLIAKLGQALNFIRDGSSELS